MALPESEDDVYDFVLNEIDSVPQLESLLLLWQSQPKRWPLGILASRVFLVPEVVCEISLKLVKSRLIMHDEQAGEYWYEPDGGKLDRLIGALASTYSHELVRISNLIHSKRSSTLQDFSRAFKFTKGGQ